MSRLLTWVLRLLWVLGVVLLAVGLVGDLRHWWDGLAYTPNVLAGATGACFGIPIAFFVLQRLANQRDRETRKAEVLALARNTIVRIREVGIGPLTEGLRGPDDVFQARQAVTEVRHALGVWRRTAAHRPFHEMEESLRPLSWLFILKLVLITRARVPIDPSWLEKGRVAARFLSDAINTRLIEQTLEPLPGNVIAVVWEFFHMPDDRRLLQLLADFWARCEELTQQKIEAEGACNRDEPSSWSSVLEKLVQVEEAVKHIYETLNAYEAFLEAVDTLQHHVATLEARSALAD